MTTAPTAHPTEPSYTLIETASDTRTEVLSQGSGRSLVLLHGLQSNARVWDKVCEHLPGIRSIRMNFLGRGASSSWRCAPPTIDQFYSMGSYARQLHGLLVHLDQPVTLAGWSMGAMVALEYVKRYGTAQLASLALCSGLSKVQGVANLFHASDDNGLLEEIASRAARAGLGGIAQPQTVLHSWKSMQQYDCTDILSQLDVPTVVVHGVEDQECPYQDAQYAAGRIPGARLVSLEGAGHLTLLERPEAVAQAIAQNMPLSHQPRRPQ